MRDTSVNAAKTGERLIITDPKILASLRASKECMERCERLERMTMRRGRSGWVMV